MNKSFATAMRRAAAATREFDLAGATRLIQEALGGRGQSETASAAPQRRDEAPAARRPPIDRDAEVIEPSVDGTARPAEPRAERIRRPLGDVVRLLRESGLGAAWPGADGGSPVRTGRTPPPVADGAEFQSRSFTGPAGSRTYRLYVPASARLEPRGLVLMLHGCKQDPDDFAVGTGMNRVAEANGLVVAYPAQIANANPSACWNWFSPAHQRRGAGEPAILAGITQEVAAEFGLGRDRVFVAGLSAGGAMADVMVETYPDLFAAAGIHSGLPYRAATDVVSALGAMRGDAVPAGRVGPRPDGPVVRRIVFHGSADRTVHPSNAERIVSAAAAARDDEIRHGGSETAGDRTVSRRILNGADGAALLECWVVDGAGHAWFGGDPRGSYADPRGPDASAEMARFFLAG
jgi:poly(hydroxyalkanoate) depolymerase family esterase